MRFEVTLPSLGDDEDAVKGGRVSFWLAEIGAVLQEGDDLLELTTDKAAFIVPCPKDGILKETCVAEGDSIAAGDVLCILETEDKG
ncbi:MAG TPA: lipoyl domain-containing protein [Candidatus Hydrogenedentes bacterium]|nr:lipoyl domain-containing protein [Candidatus Hydrogenedentota bacterium]